MSQERKEERVLFLKNSLGFLITLYVLIKPIIEMLGCKLYLECVPTLQYYIFQTSFSEGSRYRIK